MRGVRGKSTVFLVADPIDPFVRTAVYTFSLATQNTGIGSDSLSKDLTLRVVFYVKGKDFIKMNYSVVHNCSAQFF